MAALGVNVSFDGGNISLFPPFVYSGDPLRSNPHTLF